MDDKLKVALWTAFIRGMRTTVGLVLGAGVAHYLAQPAWVALGPAVNMLGKFLREKYKIDWLPV